MAELEKTVKGLQAGTAADSQQVGQILPPQEVDLVTRKPLHLLFLGSEFLLSYFLWVREIENSFSKSSWFNFFLFQFEGGLDSIFPGYCPGEGSDCSISPSSGKNVFGCSLPCPAVFCLWAGMRGAGLFKMLCYCLLTRTELDCWEHRDQRGHRDPITSRYVAEAFSYLSVTDEESSLETLYKVPCAGLRTILWVTLVASHWENNWLKLIFE